MESGSAHAAPSVFTAPREVLAGAGASGQVAAALARWSVPPGPVYVVRDVAVARHRLADGLMDALAAAGFTVRSYDEIAAEPTRADAEAVIGGAREHRAGCVIGIGGGSSMDMAKLAAAYADQTCGFEEILTDPGRSTGGVPLVLVPTTAGTGAETSKVSMVSVDGHKRILVSPFFVPLLAVLDPELILALPAPVTASSGLDALSHAFEAYVSTQASALTDSAGRAAMDLLASSLRDAWADGGDRTARERTLVGAHLAGRSLNAGVVVGHSIGYTMADRVHLPHGYTTGFALPYALAYSWPAVHDRLEPIARDWAARTDGTVAGLLGWLAALSGELGAPRCLATAGIERDDLAGMVEDCLERYPRPNNPVPLERERLAVLYRHMYDGDLEAAVAALRTAG